MISPQELRELLHYNARTGELHWRVDVSCAMKAGMRAGCDHWRGYRVIGVRGTLYMEHRVAWAIRHGQWPKWQLDHKNCIKDDNRISNLREATGSQNTANSKPRSGVKGVFRDRGERSWRARIYCRGIAINLGSFKSKAEAASVAAIAHRKAYGEFSRTL